MAKMDKGWILLHRTIQDNWIWGNHEYAYAWIDLLLLANHEDSTIEFRGMPKDVKRGTVVRSKTWLANRWGWSRNKVRTFLSTLEQQQMCTTKSTREGTTITLVKYDDFQHRPPTKSTTKSTSKGTTDSTTEGTTDGTHTKNVKRIKKNEERKSTRLSFEEGEYEAYVARTGGRV